MTRKFIAISHINWLIAEQVRKHEACIGITPIAVHWHVEDEQGCNWNVNIWKGEASCVDACKACIVHTVQTFRTQYNLIEPF
jgi:hypothetical protein